MKDGIALKLCNALFAVRRSTRLLTAAVLGLAFCRCHRASWCLPHCTHGVWHPCKEGRLPLVVHLRPRPDRRSHYRPDLPNRASGTSFVQRVVVPWLVDSPAFIMTCAILVNLRRRAEGLAAQMHVRAATN